MQELVRAAGDDGGNVQGEREGCVVRMGRGAGRLRDAVREGDGRLADSREDRAEAHGGEGRAADVGGTDFEAGNDGRARFRQSSRRVRRGSGPR